MSAADGIDRKRRGRGIHEIDLASSLRYLNLTNMTGAELSQLSPAHTFLAERKAKWVEEHPGTKIGLLALQDILASSDRRHKRRPTQCDKTVSRFQYDRGIHNGKNEQCRCWHNAQNFATG